ncbi:hypothetical protein FSOLCH5_011959 [Fusarium solani]
MAESVPIPEPPGYPLIGNLGEFTTSPLADLKRLADTYGPIFRLRLPGKSPIFASSNAFVNELCDEKRFQKTLKSVLGVSRLDLGAKTPIDTMQTDCSRRRSRWPLYGLQ